MELKTIDLLKLQTKFMQTDETTKAMTQALNPQLQAIATAITKALILPRINELSEEILDALAYDLHIDWYDADADMEIKRELIKNSDKVHMYLGTPYAVEQVVQDYFGDGYVEEWFEYDGQPYHFRVVTTNPSVTSDLADRFNRAIDKVKRKSTVLEQVLVAMSADLQIYCGVVLHTGDQYIVEQVG